MRISRWRIYRRTKGRSQFWKFLKLLRSYMCEAGSKGRKKGKSLGRRVLQTAGQGRNTKGQRTVKTAVCTCLSLITCKNTKYALIIFIVAPCILKIHWVLQTNKRTNYILVEKFYIKTLRMLLHVSILRSSSGSTYCYLLKLHVKIVIMSLYLSVMWQHICK